MTRTILTLAIAAIAFTILAFTAGPGHFSGLDLAATACAWGALLTFTYQHLTTESE